jgi:hypothetical protein
MSDVGTIGFAVDTSPVDRGTASLDRFTKGSEAAAAALAKMEAATSKAFAKVSPGMMGDSAGGTAGYNAHAVGIGAVASALDGFTVSSGKASAATGAHAAVLRSGTEAHKAHGAAVGFSTSKLMELQHVGRSVIDVMAAGGSMTRAFTLEGGRLFEIFGPGTAKVRGAIEAFQAIPLAARLAGGAIAGVGVASALAFAEYESGQDKLERSLNGVGRRSGATTGQLQGVAAQGAASGRLSIGEATDLTSRFTAAGLTPDLTGSLLGITRDYGRVTGQSTGDAGTALAAAMRDPVKGLADFDKSLAFVDDRLQQQVTDLERSGHLHEAQALAMTALKAAVDGAKDSTWAFTKGLNSAETWLGNKFNQAGAGMAAAFGLNSDADKLAEMRTRADNLQRVDPVGNGDYIAEIRRQMVPLMASVQADELKAAADKRDADATALSRQAGDAVRSILPDITRARSAADTLDVLRQAMGDPLIRQHMSPDEGRLVSRAYGQAGVVSDMARPGLRQRQDYDLRMAAIEDSGTQDQGLNAARKAELAVLRETGDVVRAATAAQQSYNETIAKANSDAEERLRQAQLDSKLVGLSPYDRAMQQLKNQYEGPRGILERDRVDSTSILDDADIKRDLTGASKWTSSVSTFTAALDGASQRLAAFPGAASGPYGAGPRPLASNAAGVALGGGFDSAVNRTFGFEGGLLARDTNGTPSNFGINQANHPGVDVPHLTQGQAKGIYRSDYWNPLGLDQASPGMQRVAFDTGVMEGVGQAKKLMAQSGGDAGKMLDLRQQFEGGLLQKDPGKYGPFQKSWALRDASLRADLGPIGTTAVGASGVDHSTMTVHAASPALTGPAPIASTAYGSDKGVYAQKQADLARSFGDVPIDQANKLLTAQSALLATNRDSFGQSAAAIRGAAEAQSLWNKLALDGIVPIGELSKATGVLADQVRRHGSDVEKFAQQQDDQRREQQSQIATADSIRGLGTDVFGGGFTAMAHGQSFSNAASSALSRFGDGLINKGVSSIFGGLMGGQGSPFGGLLGGLFSELPHHAGGTTDAPGGPTIVGESGPELVQMPAHAQVMTADQTSGLMASRSPAIPPIKMGDVHFHASGEGAFSDRQTDMLVAQHAETQQKMADHMVRNFGQIQRDAGQY